MKKKAPITQMKAKPKGVWKQHRRIEKFLYLLPSIVIFLVFMVWPIIYNIYLSKSDFKTCIRYSNWCR